MPPLTIHGELPNAHSVLYPLWQDRVISTSSLPRIHPICSATHPLRPPLLDISAHLVLNRSMDPGTLCIWIWDTPPAPSFWLPSVIFGMCPIRLIHLHLRFTSCQQGAVYGMRVVKWHIYCTSGCKGMWYTRYVCYHDTAWRRYSQVSPNSLLHDSPSQAPSPQLWKHIRYGNSRYQTSKNPKFSFVRGRFVIWCSFCRSFSI